MELSTLKCSILNLDCIYSKKYLKYLNIWGKKIKTFLIEVEDLSSLILSNIEHEAQIY